MKLFNKEELIMILVLSVFFYAIFYAATVEYENVEIPQQIKTEQQKTKENLNILLMDIAKDLCRADPKQNMASVSIDGKTVECK